MKRSPIPPHTSYLIPHTSTRKNFATLLFREKTIQLNNKQLCAFESLQLCNFATLQENYSTQQQTTLRLCPLNLCNFATLQLCKKIIQLNNKQLCAFESLQLCNFARKQFNSTTNDSTTNNSTTNNFARKLFNSTTNNATSFLSSHHPNNPKHHFENNNGQKPDNQTN